jgi:transcriptional regulator with XRE-family HTH domain
MSAQQLAERCEQLGLSIPRPVLSNLENGRRESVTLAELLVLAAALDVSPIALIVPLGLEEDLEVLPRLTVTAWDAAKWIDGESKAVIELTDNGPVLGGHRGPTAFDYFRAHDAVIAAGEKLLDDMTKALARDDNYGARTYRAAAERNLRELSEIRGLMEEQNLIVPPLPTDLRGIEGARESSTGRARRQAERDLDLEAGS